MSDLDEDDVDQDQETREVRRRGKRQIFYDCAAIIKNSANEPELAFETIKVTVPSDGQDFDPKRGQAEAIEFFKKKFGVEPSKVTGPFYFRIGIQSPAKKRDTINSSINERIPFTSRQGRAIYKFNSVAWNVIVNFTEDPNIVYIFPRNAVDKMQVTQMLKEGKKVTKPPNKYLPINVLEDLKEEVRS